MYPVPHIAWDVMFISLYLRVEWWYFILILSKSLPKNIVFVSTPKFGTPSVPPLCRFPVLVLHPQFPLICLCGRTVIHGGKYPAPVTQQPRKGGRTGKREAIILFLTVRLQRPCRMRTDLVPVTAFTVNPCFPARDLGMQRAGLVIRGQTSDGGVSTELVVWKDEEVYRRCSQWNVWSPEH